MSTLRVSNIEAKADASSPSVNEKVKVTNSSGDVLIHVNGETTGITTVGVNTTGKTFNVNANQKVSFVGDIITSSSVGVGSDNPTEKLDVNGTLKVYANTNTATFKNNQLRSDAAGAYYFDHGTTGQSFTFRTSTSSSLDTTGPSVTSAGNISFPSGKGIDFSATTGPSDGADTSELLNDYEEGTFTPLFGASVTNPTYTTSAVDGYYTKIGNQVTCWGLIVVSGTPTNGSGNWLITSLPYAGASGLSYRQNGIIGYNDVLTNEVNKLYIVGGASFCQIIPNGVTQSNETYNSNAITTGYFSFTITYRI